MDLERLKREHDLLNSVTRLLTRPMMLIEDQDEHAHFDSLYNIHTHLATAATIAVKRQQEIEKMLKVEQEALTAMAL